MRQSALSRWSEHDYEDLPEQSTPTMLTFDLRQSEGIIQFLRTIKETIHPYTSGFTHALQPAFPLRDEEP